MASSYARRPSCDGPSGYRARTTTGRARVGAFHAPLPQPPPCGPGPVRLRALEIVGTEQYSPRGHTWVHMAYKTRSDAVGGGDC
jgi:hypothetical protein